MSLISECKRRNVLQVAVAYAVVWWLLVQVAGLLLDAFDAPAWVLRAFIVLLSIGFPIALIVSWFFEWTPGGLVRSDELPESGPHAAPVKQYLNPVIISMLTAAVVLFALDKFVWTDSPLIDAPSAGPAATSQAMSLAVLPFANRSNVEDDAYFVDGIHDDLLTVLAKIGSLRVVSRTSVMRYRGSELSIPEISRELGVKYVVEGGVQRAGNQVRINAQLIDAAADSHVWSETFDRELSTESLFTIQSEIARAIAAALDAELTHADAKRLGTVPTENLAAYDAYLKGRQQLLYHSIEAYEAATRYFEHALQLDSAFAGAYAGLCEAQLRWYVTSGDTAHFDAAESACRQALAIDSDQAEVRIALGALFRHYGEYIIAENELRQALKLQPENVDALIELGLVLALQGETRKAESVLLRAETLQPGHWPAPATLISFYRSFDDRPERYERAVKYAMRVVELQPDSASAWNNLGTAYHSLQQYDAAKAAWDRALELEPTRTAYTNRGLQYYYDGEYADAVAMQRKATEIAPSDHRAWGRLAESYRLLGGEEQAAREAYAKAIELAEAKLAINNQDWRTQGLLATYYAHSGSPGKAASLIDSALSISGRDPEALLYAAQVSHRLGDETAALDVLEEMIAGNGGFRVYVADDPDFSSLRGNPRFDRLVEP